MEVTWRGKDSRTVRRESRQRGSVGSARHPLPRSV